MHRFEFDIVCRDQQFPALLIRYALLPAEVDGFNDALFAEFSLETAGLVINTGMNDTTVMPVWWQASCGSFSINSIF